MKKLTYIFMFLFSIVVTSQDWKNSFDDALKVSKNENKPVVLVFAGSDWCAPCIKLEKTIWQSEEFISYSKEHYVLFKADFPRKKNNQLSESLANMNKTLAEQFNPKGFFPLVVVLGPNGNILGKTGYEKLSPNKYIALINSFLK